jgi:hypothetical protein
MFGRRCWYNLLAELNGTELSKQSGRQYILAHTTIRADGVFKPGKKISDAGLTRRHHRFIPSHSFNTHVHALVGSPVMSAVSVPETLGAMLLGGFFASLCVVLASCSCSRISDFSATQ